MTLEQCGPISTAPLVLRDRPDPLPSAGEVVIAVEACAVCRTDLQLVEGDLAPVSLPIVPGHQAIGRVRAVGDDVASVRVGDRVGVAWLAESCGRCRFCDSDRENLCDASRFTGWHRDGGFAELMAADHRFVHPVPEAADAIALAPLLCGGAIGLRSLRVAGVRPGERIGLYGFGSSASLVIQIARHWGCEVVVATRSPVEQSRARGLGATWTGAYDEAPPFPLDRAITFAPSGDVVLAALRSVDRGGVVAVNAIHLDRIPSFPYEDLWWERTRRSVANVTRTDVHDLLELAAAVPLTTAFRTYPLAAANDALSDLRDGTVGATAVLTTR
jgi:propanol-preferring alcohol dehydrogenase